MPRSAPTTNPNRGGRHINYGSRPRYSAGRRHAVHILWQTPGARTRHELGKRPHRIAHRRPWTADRLLDLAIRAESRGHVRVAESLFERAVLAAQEG